MILIIAVLLSMVKNEDIEFASVCTNTVAYFLRLEKNSTNWNHYFVIDRKYMTG